MSATHSTVPAKAILTDRSPRGQPDHDASRRRLIEDLAFLVVRQHRRAQRDDSACSRTSEDTRTEPEISP